MFRAPPLPRTLAAALRDLKATKPSVRAESARELAAHEDADRERVVRALEEALRNDTDGSVRAAAALALADIKGVEALPALLLAMEDDEPNVRQMAITALGEIGDPRATERLRRALSDERPEVRFQAVIAFPRVCARRADAIASLMKATHDDDALVCHIAVRMAEELAGDERGEGLEDEVAKRARELLEHAAPMVRIAAAVLLARAGDARAGRVLEMVARGELKTDDGEDEAAAIELCGELGIEAAKSGLERRAFGGAIGLMRDRFAWNARVALARMGHERATREIVKELGAWDRDKRTLAVAAAGRARIVEARPLIEAMRGDAARADAGAVDEALERISQPSRATRS